MFDREHQEEPPRLTDLDDEAMAVFRELNKDKLEFFGTFAPIQELPDLPKLRFLGLYSDSQLKLVKKIVATIAYYDSTLELWERVNQHCSNVGFHFRPYNFDWKYQVDSTENN